MKKIIFVAVIAALMFTGCGADAEPIEPVETVAATIPATEPTDNAGERFSFGQIVWSVRRSADGGDAYLVRYMVVAQEGELVTVVPMFNPNPEEVREVLMDAAEMPLDGTGMVQLVQVGNCYLDPAAAQAAADRENGEASR